MSNEKSIARDTWSALCQQLGNCRTCHQETPALVDEKAFPLFGRFEGGASPLLFIAEAPNRDDTYDTVKGYLTIDYQTDPSGKFFHELFTKELGRPIEEAQLTNAALCLPAPQHGKYPLSAKQRKHCAPHIKQQSFGRFPHPSLHYRRARQQEQTFPAPVAKEYQGTTARFASLGVAALLSVQRGHSEPASLCDTAERDTDQTI